MHTFDRVRLCLGSILVPYGIAMTNVSGGGADVHPLLAGFGGLLIALACTSKRTKGERVKAAA